MLVAFDTFLNIQFKKNTSQLDAKQIYAHSFIPILKQ